MPPKAKFTREQIIEAAFEIARVRGLEAVTARALGAQLGSSARPIFSVFESMEEVQKEVGAYARRLYRDYVTRGLSQTEMPAFKGVGMQYINFAITEPKLFQILFMTEQPEKPDVLNVLPVIDESYPQILASIRNGYHLDAEEAERLYRHLWIYTHGIAVLCATNMCTFTAEEMGKMMTQVCVAILKEIKGEKKND